MRKLKPYKEYKKGLKKFEKSGLPDSAGKTLLAALDALAKNIKIPDYINYHALHGAQKGLFQIHIHGTQWVLVIKPEPDVVHLYCLGSHRECNK